MKKNIRVFAENASINGTELSGFNIILDFSGERHFVCWHRHDGMLYMLLKDGVRVEELRRMTARQLSGRCTGGRYSQKKKTDHLIKSVARLSLIVSEYITEYETLKYLDRAPRELSPSFTR